MLLLLIACIVIYGFKLSGWFYVLAAFLYLLKVLANALKD
jgi:hypothetical protein